MQDVMFGARIIDWSKSEIFNVVVAHRNHSLATLLGSQPLGVLKVLSKRAEPWIIKPRNDCSAMSCQKKTCAVTGLKLSLVSPLYHLITWLNAADSSTTVVITLQNLSRSSSSFIIAAKICFFDDLEASNVDVSAEDVAVYIEDWLGLSMAFFGGEIRV